MSLSPRRLVAVATILAASALALAGCGSSDDPLADSGDGAANAGTLVVGSQQYYSNEIVAEIYAQALEQEGLEIDRQFQIGQREVYLPELRKGAIDVFPEYTGNLLLALDQQATAKSADAVAAALREALPEGLRALDVAAASDQDSYNVTRASAERFGLKSIADLAKLESPITVAANSELQTRDYGPKGLRRAYGLQVKVVPVEDSGGPLTVKALKSGSAQVADIYSADPNIAKNDLVTLSDPENLILPQNVVPIVSDKVDARAAAVLNAISGKLTTEELVKLNARSVAEQAAATDIARDWLADQNLPG